MTPDSSTTDTADTSDARDASLQYAAAHAAHYMTKNLREAIGHYNSLIAEHPDSPEAGYSRTQILNIASQVVSKGAILEAHTSMTLTELANDKSDDVESVTGVISGR